MGYDTTDFSTELPRDPLGQHPWARHPDWDEIVVAAIRRFLSKGGKITYCRFGQYTIKVEDRVVQAKRGPRPLQEQMTKEEWKTYRKLRNAGIDKQEAVRVVCPRLLGKFSV